MSETGEQMKKRRKQLNMSADELAEKLGVSRSTIFRYEKGDIDKVPVEYIGFAHSRDFSRELANPCI